MVRKKEKTTLEKGVEVAQEITQAEKNKNEALKYKQEIANLCTSIGDRSFVIRQAKGDITSFHAQIDQLRDKLRALESQSGSQAIK